MDPLLRQLVSRRPRALGDERSWLNDTAKWWRRSCWCHL